MQERLLQPSIDSLQCGDWDVELDGIPDPLLELSSGMQHSSCALQPPVAVLLKQIGQNDHEVLQGVDLLVPVAPNEFFEARANARMGERERRRWLPQMAGRYEPIH